MNPLSNFTWESIATASDTRNEPRHRWFWVKEGFSPIFVQTAIKSEGCSPTDLVVDPFCGSGTVTLEAARCQMPSAAAEVNPFLAFAARTKTLTATDCSVLFWRERAIEGIQRGSYSPLIGLSTFAKTNHERGLFNQSVLKGFHGSWQSLESAPETIKDLLRLCLLRSVLECANFSRDGKALRYREPLIGRRFGRRELIDTFCSRVADLIEDIAIDRVALASPRIDLADSRSRLSEHFGGFKLCVTSPTIFELIRLHRHLSSRTVSRSFCSLRGGSTGIAPSHREVPCSSLLETSSRVGFRSSVPRMPRGHQGQQVGIVGQKNT